MKKFKKSAFSLVAVAALALVSQGSASANAGRDFHSAIGSASRGAFDLQNTGRSRQDRVFQMQTGDGARSARDANRMLRFENRHNVDTAATLNSLRDQRTIRLNSLELNGLPADLNLNSRRDNYVLNNLSGNVTISRAGQDIEVNNSTKLTAAEVAAVYQVLNESGQSLTLGRKGNADGGSLTLDAAASNGLTSLNIPKNVSVTGDFTSAAELSIGGDLRNAGSLVVRSSDPSLAAATISADNIRNARTGSIATIDTASGALNLSLFANMDIVNQGTISGTGDVSLTAGGSIQNVSDGGAIPTITAGTNVNLQSANIINQGVVSATVGGINLANQLAGLPTNKVISINGQGGAFNAGGDITIGSNSFDSSTAILLSGGDYHSTNLVVNAGAGSADGIVGDVTGQLKVNANIAHIGASTDNLVLGQCVIAGDPTFFNNAGNITIGGDLSFGEAIAILASGDVTDGGAAKTITARSGDDGQNVTIIAGVSLTAINGALPTDNTDGSPIAAGTSVQVGKTSKTGGDINLASTSIAASGLNNGSGGDVLLIAAGTKKTGGHVNIANVTASGSGTGDNGNIDIVGSANTFQAITTNVISTGAGSGEAGNVTLTSSAVTFSKGFSFDASGNYNNTGTITLAKKLSTGNIGTQAVSVGSGQVSYTTGGAALINAGIVANGTAGKNGGTIDVVAGSISINGNISSFGGVGGVDLDGNGLAGGNGGNVNLIATEGAISLNSGLIYTQGGNGGNGQTTVADGRSGGTGGASGNVNMNAATTINLDGSIVAAFGGGGGNGANGSGTNGAAGGAAGAGGSGGNVSMTAGGDVSINTAIISFGGNGGTGGNGAGNSFGFGGAGGDGAQGGAGGDIRIFTSGSGNISLADNRQILSAAGFGNNAGSGGAGSSGGIGGDAAAGANSGSINIQLETGTLSLGNNSVIQSVAANGGSAGDGGTANGVNGFGGIGGSAAQGGFTGNIDINTSLKGGSVIGIATSKIQLIGGHGGRGGDGGNADGDGTGNGGAGGDTFEGGRAGTVTITGATITLPGEISSRTDSTSTFFAGDGGSGSNNTNGLGGNGGAGGDVMRNTEEGGRGGNVVIVGGVVNVNLVNVAGTAGGIGGTGGIGGASATGGSGGDGGDGGFGGAGEAGGSIEISGSQITAATLQANGNASGNGGSGANGGSANTGYTGGNGGFGGRSGQQGAGGIVNLTTAKGKTPDISILLVDASAGGAGTSGSGGDGGHAGVVLNGLGGDAGQAGSGEGKGGTVTIDSARNTVIGTVTVAGGTGDIGGTGGDGTVGGAGAAGTVGGDGGSITATSKKGNFDFTNVIFTGGSGSNGSMAGNGGGTVSSDGSNGGAGGTFTVTTSGATTITSVLNGSGGRGGDGGAGSSSAVGGYGVNGGNGGTFSVDGSALIVNANATLRGGAGGDGGATGANADGGFAAYGGNGGTGGTFSLANVKGDTNINSLTVSGGNGGAGANGVNSVNLPAVVGGNGGNGGNGGTITTTKVGGNISADIIHADGGNAGNGGLGGSPTSSPQATDGDAGADAGDGGIGGRGGAVSLLAGKKKVVDIGTALSADGGTGGDGGNGGSGDVGSVSTGAGGDGGNGGFGGNGGSVTTSVVPTTPATANGGLGGFGGSGGDGDPQGNDGLDGNDGANGTVSP